MGCILQRLVVCLEESIYIHNIKDMKLLKTLLNTPSNPSGKTRTRYWHVAIKYRRVSSAKIAPSGLTSCEQCSSNMFLMPHPAPQLNSYGPIFQFNIKPQQVESLVHTWFIDFLLVWTLKWF